MNTPHINVWDLPTRLFHWLLVVLIVAMIVTGKIGGNVYCQECQKAIPKPA